MDSVCRSTAPRIVDKNFGALCYFRPAKMADSKAPFTVRIRKLLTNPLLQRKQMCVDLLHLGRANVSRKELQQRLMQQFKVQDPRCIIIANLATAFGGGRSRGQALIYDDFKAAQRFEHHYRLVRMGVAEAKPKKGRRAAKELKNRKKKVSGHCRSPTLGGSSFSQAAAGPPASRHQPLIVMLLQGLLVYLWVGCMKVDWSCSAALCCFSLRVSLQVRGTEKAKTQAGKK